MSRFVFTLRQQIPPFDTVGHLECLKAEKSDGALERRERPDTEWEERMIGNDASAAAARAEKTSRGPAVRFSIEPHFSRAGAERPSRRARGFSHTFS